MHMQFASSIHFPNRHNYQKIPWENISCPCCFRLRIFEIYTALRKKEDPSDFELQIFEDVEWRLNILDERDLHTDRQPPFQTFR